MSEKILNLSATEISDANYWIQKRLLLKLEPYEPRMVDDDAKTSEERLLEAFHYVPKVFYTLGGNGASVWLLGNPNPNKMIDVFDLSFYEDPENDPTVKYLRSHSIDDIFIGKNPDMVPESICIVEGGNGIVEINFRVSEELKANGVEGSFLLNRNKKGGLGVMINGRYHVVGYTDSDEQNPYVRVCFGDGVSCQMVFSPVS